MNGPISPSKDGWLIGAASDGENVVLGADGIPYLKIAPDGTITRMNGARIIGPVRANVSGAGVSIGDNVAGNVASVTLPANTLRRLGDKIVIFALFSGDTGLSLSADLTLNGISLTQILQLVDDSVVVAIATVFYVDATHAHFSTDTGSRFSDANVSGFNFAADQTIAVTQDQVADNKVIVYAITVDVFQGAL